MSAETWFAVIGGALTLLASMVAWRTTRSIFLTAVALLMAGSIAAIFWLVVHKLATEP
jgi:hypothetical protein